MNIDLGNIINTLALGAGVYFLKKKAELESSKVIGGTAAQTTVDEVKQIAIQARDEARLANSILLANGMTLPKSEDRGPG